MRTHIFGVVTLVTLLCFSVVAYLRFTELTRLESSLFTCRDSPRLCSSKDSNATVILEEPDNLLVYNYLSGAGGFTDVQPAQFSGTTAPRYVNTDPLLPQLSTGLSGGNELDGFQRLVCPVDDCGLFADYDSAVIVEYEDRFEPVVRHWRIEPSQLMWQGLTLRSQGLQTQHILIVIGGREAVDNGGGLAQRPALIDSALQQSETILWEKTLEYSIECTLSGCTKTYQAATVQ